MCHSTLGARLIKKKKKYLGSEHDVDLDQGLEFRVWVLKLKVEDFGFRVEGSLGLRV